jgi:ubiquinone/menaquinone biosynthesis C-methylase UbiE
MTDSKDTTHLHDPTELPADAVQAARWQAANREWWESHPMRYDWKERIGAEEFSKEFFAEIDRRFFEESRKFMPWTRHPFDDLMPFDALPESSVLEIGVGNGSHAQLLATHARQFTGIDLTEYAVAATTERLKLAGVSNARVMRMDAEALDFADATFDFIWTWGVIHHSANTPRVLAEMRRVLKPGGRAVTMVYHRSVWLYYVVIGFVRGVLLGDLLKTRSLDATVQKYTDGALARYYRADEWRALAAQYFDVRDVRVYGAKPELLPLPGGALKQAVMRVIPNSVSRLFLNRFGWGSFLVSVLEKPASR